MSHNNLDVKDGVDHNFNYEDDFEDHESDDEKSQFKKYLFSIISIILIIIIIISFLPNLYFQFFSNQLSGSFVNNTFQITDDKKILLENDVHSALINLYNHNQPNEIKVCLTGHINEGNYYVSGYYVPTIISQSYNHVSFIPCNLDTIVDLHSHPFKNCLLSNTDFNTFRKLKELNDELITGVMCSENKFIFVTN